MHSFSISAICERPKKDSTHTLKNTIHFNLTNPMIFGDGSIIFGYERVLNKRRSFTVNIGSTAFPSLDIIDADSIKAILSVIMLDSIFLLTIVFTWQKKISLLRHVAFTWLPTILLIILKIIVHGRLKVQVADRTGGQL
jgi:hypothetical protein